MAKITAIEDAIIRLGDGEFQKLCDTFLSKKEEYGAILGLGMKAGTSKTTKGNPDTYFRKENGKYVFVAYTTQQSGIYQKLKEDIEKCLDPNLTGVKIGDIEEIICCHTSSNLRAGDDQKLHIMCEEKGIKLTIYGVDELAQQIYRKHPIIAKDFLCINIDTNQIMSITDFVNYYNSSETAAPVDTIFQGREKELEALIEAIQNNKVVIIHGQAGVGKTRLALEAVNKIAIDEDCTLLCVKSNNLELHTDLVAKIEKPGKYLFFVDDANELSGLNLILDYITKETEGYQINIVLTVRNYVREGVIRSAQKYTIPKLLEIKPFSDEEIKAFLEVNMNIRNERFVDQIIIISEGNPRIAYMAGKLAMETGSLRAIHDATQVYEQYYAAIIDLKLGKKRNLCVTAGILALVSAAMLDKLGNYQDLFELGKIKKEEFEECIQELSLMEVVEVHLNKVASISDQCFANYMLYHVLVSERSIPLSGILEVGLKNFKDSIIRTMNSLLNLFANESVSSYILDEVKKTWKRLEEKEDPCFEEFARVFHTFRPVEAFLIARNKINQIPEQEEIVSSIDFEKGAIKSDDDILGFLTGYNESDHLTTVMDLLLEYVQKNDENAIIGFNWLKNHYGIKQDSYIYDYYDEVTILNVLKRYLLGNGITKGFILAYVKYVLSFEFDPAEMGRGNTVTLYRFQIKNSQGVRTYRKECWNILSTLLPDEGLHNDIKRILKHYAASICNAEDQSIVLYDKSYVENILDNFLNKSCCSNIEMGAIIRDLQHVWQKCDKDYTKKYNIFESNDWNLYALLGNSFMYSDLDFEEYKMKKENDLRTFAESLSAENIRNFICIANRIILEVDESEKYDVNSNVNQILRYACVEKNITVLAIAALLNDDIELYINPIGMLRILFENLPLEEIWNTLDEKECKQKNVWEYAYFEALPENMVDVEVYQQLQRFLESDSDQGIDSSPCRNIRIVDKFLVIDSNAYVTVARLIFDKKSYSKLIVRIYFSLMFNESVYEPSDLVRLFVADLGLLKDIYFFMLENSDLEDHNGRFLAHFFLISDEWIDTYAEFLCDSAKNGNKYRAAVDRLQALWMLDDYLRYFDTIFDKISENRDYLFTWRLGKAFKSILTCPKGNDYVAERQEEWVLHVVRNYCHDDKIIFLFDALSNSNELIRKSATREFLAHNSDYEMFQKLKLDSSDFCGYISGIIPDLQRKIEYLKSLQPYVSGMKYLKHAKRIEDRIDMLQEQIKHEEMEAIYRKLFK